MSVACVIIASEKRHQLVKDRVLPSVLRFLHEIYVVGDFEEGEGYTYLPVPPLTRTTNDALVKRDVGTLATQADWVLYLSDDHALAEWDCFHPHQATADIIVPKRFCTGHGGVVPLNMGLDPLDPNAPYCGGHAGLFRRSLIVRRPWCTMPHDRLWDLYASSIYRSMGARIVEAPSGFAVEDLEPEAEPWR